MKHLDLFSGIGGFALAASWLWGAEHEIVSFCEIDPFCQKVLKKHWPDVPCHDDIKTLKGSLYEKVDLLTAGYPCQAYSTASRGRKTAEDMLPIFIKKTKEIFPKWVIAENVNGKTIKDCAKELENIGYSTKQYNLSAASIGADHIRNRWFVLAYSNYKSQFQSSVYAEMDVVQSLSNNPWKPENYARTLRVSNGISNWTHRLRSLGNAIVPQIVVPIMNEIKIIESGGQIEKQN